MYTINNTMSLSSINYNKTNNISYKMIPKILNRIE